jgi:polyhydroxyalkanoate synthesis regulator phasin
LCPYGYFRDSRNTPAAMGQFAVAGGGACRDEPVTAAQVALLQRGEEILAARPPLVALAARPPLVAHAGAASMRSTSVELDEGTVQRLGDVARRREAGGPADQPRRYTRQAAAVLSMAVLVCCVLLLQLGTDQSSPPREAPVALSASVLAGEDVDWLGGGMHGDPYTASDGESSHRRAHIARAALQAEAGWKTTVGKLFHDWKSADAQGGAHKARGGSDHGAAVDAARPNPFAPPRDREPHGKLLSPAKEGQQLWHEQIKAMQAGELQANRMVMNTVSLLKQDKHEFASVHSTWNPPAAVKLSAASERKAAAHARLISLSTKKGSAEKPEVEVTAHVQAAKAAKTAAVVKTVAKGTPAQAQVLHAVSMKPTDLAALDVATSDSSRDELNNFFDTLAAHDEAKHVLHEARYPHRQSMRQLLPTSIMPAKPKKSEVKHLQHEVTWLRKRVEVLQDALLKGDGPRVAAVDRHATKEHSSRTAAVGKHGGTTNATQALHTGEQAGDANSVKAPKELHEPAAAADKSPPSQDYLALIRPPPRGCPLFAAPGERLPADCPRYLASARACPDQSNKSVS